MSTPASRAQIFVSSVQKELASERRAVKDFVQSDALLRRYFDVFLFEDLPASGRRADEVYLAEVDRCTVYVGLFGNDYGFEDSAGISPTEREFDRATLRGCERLVFVKGADDTARHPKMRALVRKAGAQVVRRRFDGTPELIAGLYASLVEHLERVGDIRRLPFDAAACPGASLDDLAPERVAEFLARAQRNRGYTLKPDTPVRDALVHLKLLDGGRPSHAAVLLFGKAPQRFLLTSHVKCLHFHGTEVRKPIPSYQVYEGTVFELIDRAVEFVLSRINRTVGTRAHGPQAPVNYELPEEAVAEAIVNAVAHRDYASAASVQMMLFADRLEIWNPGHLPPPLTPESLRVPHASLPRNPLLAEPLFLTRYIERAGTGTLDMIRKCAEAGLPSPAFRHDDGQFVQTLWRDAMTPAALAGLGLNDRQRKALAHVRGHGRITNSEYQVATGATKKTSSRDLEALVAKGVFVRLGTTGRGTSYRLAAQRDIKGTKETRPATKTKRDNKGTKGTATKTIPTASRRSSGGGNGSPARRRV
jgi:predicted HTH transcriptional regulator